MFYFQIKKYFKKYNTFSLKTSQFLDLPTNLGVSVGVGVKADCFKKDLAL